MTTLSLCPSCLRGDRKNKVVIIGTTAEEVNATAQACVANFPGTILLLGEILSGVRAGSASDPSWGILCGSRHVRSLALAARIFPSVKAPLRKLPGDFATHAQAVPSHLLARSFQRSQCFRQPSEQVTRNQGRFTDLARRQVAAEAMQVNTKAG